MGTLSPEHTADEVDIGGALDKRGGDHVNVVLEAKVNDVGLIFLRENGEVDNAARQVHVLSFADLGVVEYFYNNRFLKTKSARV